MASFVGEGRRRSCAGQPSPPLAVDARRLRANARRYFNPTGPVRADYGAPAPAHMPIDFPRAGKSIMAARLRKLFFHSVATCRGEPRIGARRFARRNRSGGDGHRKHLRKAETVAGVAESARLRKRLAEPDLAKFRNQESPAYSTSDTCSSQVTFEPSTAS